jgi:hypothetical protein
VQRDSGGEGSPPALCRVPSALLSFSAMSETRLEGTGTSNSMCISPSGASRYAVQPPSRCQSTETDYPLRLPHRRMQQRLLSFCPAAQLPDTQTGAPPPEAGTHPPHREYRILRCHRICARQVRPTRIAPHTEWTHLLDEAQCIEWGTTKREEVHVLRFEESETMDECFWLLRCDSAAPAAGLLHRHADSIGSGCGWSPGGLVSRAESAGSGIGQHERCRNVLVLLNCWDDYNRNRLWKTKNGHWLCLL